MKHYKSGPTLVSEETYSDGSNGNLDSAVRNGTTTTYTYDNIDQLTQEQIANSWKQEYTYDPNGNRETFKKFNWVSGAWNTLVSDTYAYGTGDRLTSAGSKTFTYDNCGRMKTVSVSGVLQRTYHYDYQDRLITTQYPDGSGTSDTYVYNIFNSRTKLTLNGTQWSFRRDGLSATAPVLQDSTSSTTNTYVPGVSQKQGSTKKYMGTDRMGSVSHEFDSSSNTTYKAKYDAFGIYIPDTGSSTNRFGFAAQWGYQSDPNSGLQLLGNRYYDPSIGRFITRDPIKDGRNWFAYSENNPLRYVDPWGLSVFLGITGSASMLLGLDVSIGFTIDETTGAAHLTVKGNASFGPQMGAGLTPAAHYNPGEKIEPVKYGGPGDTTTVELGPASLDIPRPGSSGPGGGYEGPSKLKIEPIKAEVGMSMSMASFEWNFELGVSSGGDPTDKEEHWPGGYRPGTRSGPGGKHWN